MKWVRYGPDAWLLQFAEELGRRAFHRGRALVADLEARPPPGLVEVVPSFTSLLLEFAPGQATEATRLSMAARFRKAIAAPPPRPFVKKVPVVYDGPDLSRVAELAGLSVAEVRRRHAAKVYHVYMLGFTPGFPYLGELDPALHTPRLSSPRVAVPAGSVAIGGPHTGIYPSAGPGGWNLIGRTSLQIFIPGRLREAGVDPRTAFTLKAGDHVQFVPVHALPEASSA